MLKKYKCREHSEDCVTLLLTSNLQSLKKHKHLITSHNGSHFLLLLPMFLKMTETTTANEICTGVARTDFVCQMRRRCGRCLQAATLPGGKLGIHIISHKYR